MAVMVRRLVALVLVGALAVAGCGDDDGAEPDPTTTVPGAETTDGAAPDGDPSTDVDRTATLKVVSSIAPQQFDPVRTAFPCDFDELALIYDTLIRMEPDGSYSPGLAAEWSAVDDVTFELVLHEDVQFQDGTPFDAEAVRAHLDRAVNSTESTLAQQLYFLDEVEVVDELTVRLHLSEARTGVLPALLSDRAGMVPSPTAVEEQGDAYGSNGAVGAGPYEYAEHVPGEYLRLTRWDGYFEPDRQLLGGFESFGLSEQFQIEQLRAGELNYAALNENLLPEVEAAAEDGDLEYVIDPSPQFMQFFVNRSVEPFDDVRVRQALNHAIDREAINEAVAEGIGTIAWGPLPPNSDAHNPDVEEMYPYDPERARELLAEAGFEDGLSIETGVIQIPLYQRTAELLQDMLSDSGITLELVPVTGAEINNRLYVSQDLAAAVTAFSAPFDAGLALEARYSSGGSNNPGGATVEGLDELLEQGAASTDAAERAEIYREAELLIMEEALEVPIYHFAGLVAHRPEVKNVVMGYTACRGGNFLSPPVYITQ